MLKETIERLASKPANEYWSKVRKIAIALVTVSGVIISLPVAGLTVPAILLTSANYVLAIGAALGLSAQATK